MALPADIINYYPNPSFEAASTGITAVPGTTGVATASRASSSRTVPTGSFYAKVTWTTANTVIGGGATLAAVTLPVGRYYIGIKAGVSGITNQLLALSFTGTSTRTVVQNWTPKTVTNSGTFQLLDAVIDVTVAGTVIPNILATTGTNGKVWAVSSALYLDDIIITTTTGTNAVDFFYGDQADDPALHYKWSGTANASTSLASYRGVWVEPVYGPPAPRVQVTVAGLGTVAGNVVVTRTADGETWVVPGWNNRSVIDTDTETDWAVPLGRPVTYAVTFNGQTIGSMTTQADSTVGYIQDPLDPYTAMPINTTLLDRAALTLGAESLTERTHTASTQRAAVMGQSRPFAIGGQRIMDASMRIVLNAFQNNTSDQLRTMARASVLLIRPIPSWGSFPGLGYTDGNVKEAPVNRGRITGNNALTQWIIEGDVIAPVSRRPVTGIITNDDVQTNLTGVTYNTILARSGTKKNVDIKANPLSL